MRLDVFATGSAANSYALRSGDEILLLEAGLPVTKVMQGLKGSFSQVVGCLVTHEHKDHSKGVLTFAQTGIDLYMSEGTQKVLGLDKGFMTYRVKTVKHREKFNVGRFMIVPFDTEHDAAEPLGFLIADTVTGENVLFATDTYYLKHTFPGVHYWLVECNHSREIMDRMVEDGKLSVSLKRRLITSHMSLERLLDALEANDLSKTRKIVLLHLSDSRSDEAAMIKRVSEATRIETLAADAGMEIDLELCPF